MDSPENAMGLDQRRKSRAGWGENVGQKVPRELSGLILKSSKKVPRGSIADQEKRKVPSEAQLDKFLESGVKPALVSTGLVI